MREDLNRIFEKIEGISEQLRETSWVPTIIALKQD